ncbi:MAG: hypothetical protein JWO37_2134 [Acidimicrobiales bacterium]|jgi:hypothetical protein|nr:hypothetical protein [Acidimicrobiales bacterium]
MIPTDTEHLPSVEAEAPDEPELDEVEDDSWLAATQARGMRVRLPLAALTLGIVAALGLWGGAKLEAAQNPAATATSARAAATGRGTGATAGAGTGATGGTGARGGLSGTVTSVHGTQIQLTTSTGSIVTVNLLPSTTVTRTASAAPTDITAGETITVRGQTGSDGSTTAQNVAIVPATTTGG